MQCSCGAMLKDKQAVSKKHDAKWTYQECDRCGRIDGDVLTDYAGTKIIEFGIHARKNYAFITSEEHAA